MCISTQALVRVLDEWRLALLGGLTVLVIVVAISSYMSAGVGVRACAVQQSPNIFNLTSYEHAPRLHAGKELDDTHAPYRVAAFQTFLSGRI